MIADRFARILDFYDRELPAQRTQYRPPAPQAEVDLLPAELHPLFALCDGTGGSGAFFGSDLLSVEQAVASRDDWQLIISSSTDPQRDFHDVIESRTPNAVSALYWKTGWMPFIVDGGGNGFAVDLEPEAGGTVGQIINYGSDEDWRAVVADSLDDFLARIVTLVDSGATVVHTETGWVDFVVDGRRTHLLTALLA